MLTNHILTRLTSICWLRRRRVSPSASRLLVSGLLLVGLLGGLALRERETSVSPFALTATAAAATNSSGLPHLQGEAATDYLKEHGLYASLGEAIAAARYSVWPLPPKAEREGGEQYSASNSQQGYQSYFAPEQVRVVTKNAADEQQQVRLRLTGVGYGENLQPVAAAELHRQGQRIEYRRGALTEWYVNDQRGLEQGFTLAARPTGAIADARLRLTLALSGDLKASPSADGKAALLKDAKGSVVLRYSGLKVWDAEQRELPAKLIVKADEIGIAVDERAAVYPVTIDPMFSQVKKLTASDGVANDNFGLSVSISGDTLVVSASGDDSQRGAAYVFERNQAGADNWGEVTKLTASDGAANDNFGVSVSISGDTLVVSASGDNSRRGAAYVYERNQGGADNWGEVTKLTASDGVALDQFGTSVAINGDTLVVGVFNDNFGLGSAYVFERNAGGTDNWGEVKKLTASAGEGGFFGQSVAISGDTLVVGAQLDDSNRGAAYVFARNQGGADSWGEVKRLTASDGANNARFGYSVSLSSDTLVVGAFGADSLRGAAYVFARNQGGADNWGEVKKLTASDGAAFDFFGNSASISDDTIVVGAYDDDSARGAAYVFDRNQGGADNWGEVKKLTASDGEGGDFFGFGVSLSGDTIVVGAVGDDSSRGSAYVFASDCGEWAQIAKPEASDKGAADQFGFEVAISGDTAVVSAPEQEEGPGDNDSGAAYVFERNRNGANQWGQVKKLLSSDNAIGDAFGDSVAISGDTIIVGAPEEDDPGGDSGAAYIFGRNQGGADNWGEIKKIEASDKASGDNFGTSVGISGDTVIVGAHLEDDPGLDSGAAYIFERNQGGADNWGEVKKIEATDIANLDFFGFAVAISGDTVIVGSPLEDDPGNSGTAYIFERNQGGADNWGQIKKIKASDKEMGDRFAFDVAISGDIVIVGAPREDAAGNDAGAAYIFERNRGGADNWGEVTKLYSPDLTADNFFGYALSISGDTAIVGAPRDDDPGVESGAAYVFERNQGGADNWGQVRKIEGSDIEDKDQFGAGVGISGDTVIVGAPAPITTKTGAAYIFVLNCPPIITPQTISRQQGAAASNSTIATVLDDLTAAGSLTVALNGALPTGIAVTNLQNTNGTITTDVAAACDAALGDHLVSLQATDEHGLMSTASFTVTVTAAPTPTADVGLNQAQCQAESGPTSFTINGTATNGTAQWSYVGGSIPPGDVNVLSPNSATTGVNLTGSGTVTLKLTVTGACSTATSEVTLTVNPLPSSTISGPDQVTAYTLGHSYSGPAGANLSFSWAISGQGTFAGGGTTAAGSPVSVNAGSPGFYTLTLTVTNTQTGCSRIGHQVVTVAMPLVSLNGDYDGDGKADLAIWRPATATFWIYSLATGSTISKQWGVTTDVPVPGDYDGDGKTDIAVWRPATGEWIVYFSTNGQTPNWQWGNSTDVPVPGDYDGDGKTDLAIWRPSTGEWWIFQSSNFATVSRQWGTLGDVPVPGDYDGDGQTDLGIWRPSNATFWIYSPATGSTISKPWGVTTDVPVPGDYDGDHKTDIALWRSSTGAWLIVQSSNGQSPNWVWGLSTDVPVPGDYDGDGKTDLTVWRPSTGVWWIFKSTGGTLSPQWGTAGDLPLR